MIFRLLFCGINFFRETRWITTLKLNDLCEQCFTGIVIPLFKTRGVYCTESEPLWLQKFVFFLVRARDAVRSSSACAGTAKDMRAVQLVLTLYRD